MTLLLKFIEYWHARLVWWARFRGLRFKAGRFHLRIHQFALHRLEVALACIALAVTCLYIVVTYVPMSTWWWAVTLIVVSFFLFGCAFEVFRPILDTLGEESDASIMSAEIMALPKVLSDEQIEEICKMQARC